MTSVYELTDPLGKVRKQRFWDYFDGDALRSYWNETTVNTTGAMDDVVNGGFKYTTGSSDNDRGTLNFNNIRPFDNTAAVHIAETKSAEATTRTWWSGFSNATEYTTSPYITFKDDTDASFIEMRSRDATTASSTATTTSSGSTDWITHKLTVLSSLGQLWLDGDFAVAKTSNLPTSALQPTESFITRAVSSVRNGSIRYVECYNL